MGGYKARRTFDLEFAQYPGMEVSVRAPAVGQMLDILGTADKVASGSVTQDDFDKLVGWFAEHLVAWNLEEDDDTPIPATLESLRSLEPAIAMDIINGWTQRVISVPPPLPKRSGTGPESPAAPQIPMKPLTPSPEDQPDPGS